MDKCFLCRDWAEKRSTVGKLEDTRLYFFLWDPHPVTPGHLIVVPKRHIADYRDLTDDELRELPFAVKKSYELIESADLTKVYSNLLKDFGFGSFKKYIDSTLERLNEISGKPDAYNHGVNDGAAAGRTMDHFHYHIFPRWAGDAEDAPGGIRHFVEGKGNYIKARE